MPLYMLDTDTVSYLVRGKTPALDARIRVVPPEQVCISAVTRGELLYGLKLKDGAHRLAQVVEQFLSRVRCLPWDEAAATQFATVAADLHKAGTSMGSMDAMIAGHAIAAGAVFVTNNRRHFDRVAGLNAENWTHSH
ncbi:MAG TPA: PIN domain-containing protein [Burkholderiaceae bacterium]|nr:PIN domain-containing protein [Burkholderiaceae bacterium]